MVLDKPFDQITIEDLQDLVTSRAWEGNTLEFKKERFSFVGNPREPNEGTRKFLKAVCAFANTSGGYIIVGRDGGELDEAGFAKELCGTDLPDGLGSEIEKYQNFLIESIVPQIPFFNIKPFTLDNGKWVLLIRIDRSFSAPHVVTYGGNWKFYARGENVSYQMKYDQVQAAFLNSATLPEKVQQFRQKRLEEIHTGSQVVSLDTPASYNTACWALHIIPLATFTGSVAFNLHKAADQLKEFAGSLSFYNLDGVYSTEEKNYVVKAQSMFFRNGVFERVASLTMQKPHVINMRFIERQIIECANKVFRMYRDNNITYPFFVSVALVGVEEFVFDIPEHLFKADAPPRAIDRETLSSPEILLPNSMSAAQFFMPIFDMLWNGGSIARSPNYDASGKWVVNDETASIMI